MLLLCCSLQPAGLLTSMGFNIHLIPSGQRGYLQRKSHDSVLASHLRSGRQGPSKDFREQFSGRAKSPGAYMLSTSFPVSSFSSRHQSEWESGEVTEVMGCFVLMWDLPKWTGGRKQTLEAGWPHQALRLFDLRPGH